MQPRQEMRADAGGIAHVTARHQIKGSVGGRAGNGIAAKGIAVAAALPFFHQPLLCHHRANRQAGAQTFGERHDVRRHPPVFTGKHLAGTAHARLHFVEDQQDAVLVTQCAQAGKETIGCYQVAAFALDRFNQNRRHFRGWHIALEQQANIIKNRFALVVAGEERPIGIGIRHMSDARHGWRETFLLGGLAGGERQRAHRAAVEAAEKTDEPRPASDVARQL